MFNLFFYSKFTGNYLLFLKYSEEIIYLRNLLQLNKIHVFFSLNQLIDLNNLAISNYYFFFKYYFGVIPYFSNYQHIFKLNVHYFSFFIEYIFVEKKLFNPLFFFLNDIYNMINKEALLFSKQANYWESCINDINFFIEKKNSLGFFNLKHDLYFRFFFCKGGGLHERNLFFIYKLQIE